MEIVTRNANTLFSDGLWRLKTSGVAADSRNGPVLRIEEPVHITVKRPTERVLFHPGRDAPHIFHLLEAVWILAGRRDVAFVRQFNSRIGQFSDDGVVFNAAYGHRMRHHFGTDQLSDTIRLLRRDRTTRQAVIQLWDPADLTRDTKDKACNTQLMFSVVDDHLDMTVVNRSNDFYWGNAGANVVHFSFLLEFVAAATRLPVGSLHTLTNNLHIYTELYNSAPLLENPPNAADYDAYRHGAEPRPIMDGDGWQGFLEDCEQFCREPFNGDTRYVHSFFRKVAYPMAMVSATRNGKRGDGLGWACQVEAQDWRRAVFDWIYRREIAK